MIMTSNTATKVLLWTLLASFPAAAQSLGDLGKKEKERREKAAADSKVITNLDAERYKGGAITTGSPPPKPAEASADKVPADKASAKGEGTAKPQATGGKPPSDEPTDLQGRTETFWRQTFSDARSKIKELEVAGNVLILKLNDLRNRFYRESDGYKQQALLAEISKATLEQQQNAAAFEKAKSSIGELEKEARKAGALPGWLSTKP